MTKVRYVDGSEYNYYILQRVENKTWVCGYCSHKISSDRGYKIGLHKDGSGSQVGGIYICPNCNGATFFFPYSGRVYPSSAFGNSISHLPQEIEFIYEEARRCTSSRCYTAAVLICRKILMNLAVAQGAKEGLRFVEYVSYLSDTGYIPPNGKHWVDHIRKKGNEATHEIALMNEADAHDILIFTEMLLKFVYEFPSMVTPVTTDTSESQRPG
jgi:Domain of unknown function (DUF4145)